MEGLYVEVPGSVSSRLAAELSLAPRSTHLLIGGVGSGKTTQLLAAQRLVSQIHDVRALYIDVSKRHDIAKMALAWSPFRLDWRSQPRSMVLLA